ncbi:MAG TPA: sugar ABC transporter permease [Tepidisphaeraceae bacterium]|nr:sugar ABC transporter permease [Tepidisphaeraceae bacterium]
MSAQPRRDERLWALQHKLAPYLFVSPFVVLFCCFMIYPLARSIVLSLHKASGPTRIRFVGLENYQFLLFDQLFWLAAANTLYFAFMFLLLQIPAALGLALLLNSPKLRYRNFFRFAFFSAHLVGNVFVAIIFRLLLTERHGLVNRAIGTVFPFIGTETKWLARPELMMPSVVIAALWLSVGYGMVYFLAALQSVDRELYEAAEVDGAGNWSQFWNVTLPGIRPVLLFMIFVGTIGALQLFELPYILSAEINEGAGPNNSALTIVMYLYNMGFSVGDIGYASAVGWALVVLIFGVSLVQLKITRATAEDDR